jgi:hypothetical protein
MFDHVDSDEWVRCPECRTYFQVKQAVAREIPQLVMTKDEALLADEESESAKETVDAALDTRWDSQRTLSTSSTRTISGVESASTNVPTEERTGSEESLPPESGKDAAGRTISDLSSLATWSELPIDQIEAQARAEQAGDAPVSAPLNSETPTLRLRRSVDEDEATGEKESPESTEESDDRFDKWFQNKATIFDFTPPTTDEIDIDQSEGAQPLEKGAASPNSGEDDRWEFDIDSAPGEESSPDVVAEAEPKDAKHDRADVRGTWPPAWPQERSARKWARHGRRRSPLRTFIMIGFGGIVGLALGYYALLWIAGPRGDFLDAGRYLPSAILPRGFRSPVVKLPTNDDMTTETTSARDLAASAGDLSLGDDKPIDMEEQPPADEGNEIAAAGDTDDLARIVGAPSFSEDELAVALTSAKQAQAGLLTGDFDDGAEIKRTKGQSYKAFCDLAQKSTFVDKKSNASYASALEREVDELIRTTLADAHAQEEVARLVPLWIKSTKRTQAGIFLAGRVANQSDKGSVVECQIELASGEPLTLLVATEQAESIESSARPLAILGWIVDQPAETVHGYTGDARQAVWAGHIATLE